MTNEANCNCSKCGRFTAEYADKENGWCEPCYDEWFQDRVNFWRHLYDCERVAGLLMSEAERAQELRDAGRGHLVQ